MEANPTMINGIYSGESKEDEEEYQIFWESLVLTLNSQGPPIREKEDWRKVLFITYINFNYTIFFRIG